MVTLDRKRFNDSVNKELAMIAYRKREELLKASKEKEVSLSKGHQK